MTRSRCCYLKHLARGSARDVHAFVALLATLDVNARPSPVGASALSAEDVDGGSLGGDVAGNVLNGEASDRNAVGGRAGRGAVLVVLLDDDTLLGDLWFRCQNRVLSFEKVKALTLSRVMPL